MLTTWLTRFEKVHRATTQEEREAVYRFRYGVYVDEHNYAGIPVDHARRMLFDEADEKGEKIILYTGSLAHMTGSVSARPWGPREVPEDFAKVVALDLFPGIDRLRTAEVERLVVRPDSRGKLIVPALLQRIYEILVGECATDVVFAFCFPGLVRSYRKIGLIPYAAGLVRAYGYNFVPLVMFLSDQAALKRAGSFLVPTARRYFGPGKRAPLDTRPFQHLLQHDVVPVDADPARVWEEVQERLVTPRPAVPFIDSLSAKALEQLTRSGFLMKVSAGDTLIAKGVKDREVFVILDGLFEVVEGETRIALREPGDLVGEVAFFPEAGLRTATVRALTDGQVLTLRRKFLRELTHRDPEAGYQLLMDLGRVMAEKLAETTRLIAGGEEPGRRRR